MERQENMMMPLPEQSPFSFPDEKLLLYKRRHWIVILPPVFIAILVILFSLFSAAVLVSTVFRYPFVLITVELLVISATLIILSKIIIEWYFHLYVVTTRKILEVCYRPLCSREINDVLLNQVRCTEVDIKTKGIINELLDVGDVTITFDRPTHQEEFVFSSVKNPRSLGMFLSESLDFILKDTSAPVWYRSSNSDKPNNFKFTEQIIPRGGISL